jgi:hypothetical protein
MDFFSYDSNLLNDEFRITCSETFVSNSFSKDQFLTGLEFSWKEMVTLRGGYGYESGILDDFDDGRTTSFKGLSAGFSVELPLSDDTNFGLDYSYRPAEPLQSLHQKYVQIVTALLVYRSSLIRNLCHLKEAILH